MGLIGFQSGGEGVDHRNEGKNASERMSGIDYENHVPGITKSDQSESHCDKMTRRPMCYGAVLISHNDPSERVRTDFARRGGQI